MNSRVCSNCKESYDSSLNKCPKCGFEEMNLNQSDFNIRNPFLELRNNQLNNVNNEPLNQSIQNNVNNEIQNSSIAPNPLNNTNNINNNFLNPSTPSNLNSPNNINNSFLNPVGQPNSNSQLPISQNTLNAENITMNNINNTTQTIQNNPEIVNKPTIEPKNSEVEPKEETKPKSFEPYNDNNKYAVSGIDFNSFFNPSEEKQKQSEIKSESNNEVLNNSNETSNDTKDQNISQKDNKSQNSVLVLEGNELKEKSIEKKSYNKKPKKDINYLKYDFMFLTFLITCVLIFICLASFSLIVLIRGIINVILLLIGYKYADSKKKLAAYIGIIVSISLIFSITYKNYIDVAAGIVILIHSVYYLIKK